MHSNKTIFSNINQLISSGNWAAAKTHLQQAKANGMTQEQINQLRDGNSEKIFRQARDWLNRQEWAVAMSCADLLIEIDCENVGAHAVVFDAAMQVGDAARAELEIDWLIAAQPQHGILLGMKQHLYLVSGRPELALDVLRDGIERGLNDSRLFTSVSRMKLPDDLKAKVIEWALSLDAGATDHAKTTAAVFLEGCNIQLPSVLAAFAADRGSSIYDWSLDAPADSQLKRALVVDGSHEEVVVAAAVNPTAVVLVFTGLADRTMVPIPVFDRYFAALNISAVYLRDSSRNLYANGIASISENYPGTVDHLRRLIAELGSAPLACIGTSAGGYGALRYGIELGCQNIIGFSAVTNGTPSFHAEDGRAKIIARRVQSLPHAALDPLPAVRAARNKTRIHLVYGENMREDVRHAEYLKDEPNVKLHALPGVDTHLSLVILARQKKLLSFLKESLNIA